MDHLPSRPEIGRKETNGNSPTTDDESDGDPSEYRNLPVLGYWKIRGLAQPVRFILAYTGTDYQHKWYEIGADLNRQSWLKEKFTLGLELPNLPYWMDGDIKLTQSRAIIRHIARERDPSLLGTTAEENRRIDMLENHVWDFWMALIMICYQYSEDHKINFINSLPEQLQLLTNFIGNHKWSVSDNLTYVDFMVYEALYQHKVFAPKCLNGFSRLQRLLENFESLPSISKYMLTEAYVHRPLYTRLAKLYI